MKKKSKWKRYLPSKRKEVRIIISFQTQLQSDFATITPHVVKLANGMCKMFGMPPRDSWICDKCFVKEKCLYYNSHVKQGGTFKFTFSPAQMKLLMSKIIVKPIKSINVYGKSQRTTYKVK